MSTPQLVTERSERDATKGMRTASFQRTYVLASLYVNTSPICEGSTTSFSRQLYR